MAPRLSRARAPSIAWVAAEMHGADPVPSCLQMVAKFGDSAMFADGLAGGRTGCAPDAGAGEAVGFGAGRGAGRGVDGAAGARRWWARPGGSSSPVRVPWSWAPPPGGGGKRWGGPIAPDRERKG